MKKVLKVCLGLFLGGSLLFGGVFLAGKAFSHCDSLIKLETTDANGKTTVTTLGGNGKTSTKTYNVVKKDVTFTNKTDLTFEDIEMESNSGDEMNGMDEMNDMDDFTLTPNSQMKCESVSFHENVKTVDLKMEDDDDNTYTFKGVDVSNIQDMNNVNFVITQQGDTFSVNIAK